MIKHRKKEGMKERFWKYIYIYRELRIKTSYEKDNIRHLTTREEKMRRKRNKERIKFDCKTITVKKKTYLKINVCKNKKRNP